MHGSLTNQKNTKTSIRNLNTLMSKVIHHIVKQQQDQMFVEEEIYNKKQITTGSGWWLFKKSALIGTNESEECRFHLLDPVSSRYCNATKMFKPLVHGVISKSPPRRWCFFLRHVVILLKNMNGKRRSCWRVLSSHL